MIYQRIALLLFFLVNSLAIANEDLKSVADIIPEGSYTLKKGKQLDCPNGEVIYSKKSKRLIFGTKINFDLSQLGKLTIEKVPFGCHYEGLTSLKNGYLNKVIKIEKCPSKSEEALIIQKLSFKNKTLLFTLEKKSFPVISCQYERRGK